MRICLSEVGSAPQTMDNLTGRDSVRDFAPLHQIQDKSIVDSLGPEETVGVVQCDSVGVARQTEDMSSLDLPVSPHPCEGRQLSLLIVLIKAPPGYSEGHVSSVRDKRPARVQLNTEVTTQHVFLSLPQLTLLFSSEAEGGSLSRLYGESSTALI